MKDLKMMNNNVTHPSQEDLVHHRWNKSCPEWVLYVLPENKHEKNIRRGDIPGKRQV